MIFEYVTGHNTIPPAVSSYDSRDRKLSATQPGESVSALYSYGIEDGMFTTSNFNEESQTSKIYNDVKGRLRKTVQNNELTTQYYYNVIGEKIKVKNHQGYESHFKYDMAGRRVERRHPDSGVSIFQYDKVGNVRKEYTSNLLSLASEEAIIYDYNYDQLIGVYYPNNPENNVKYTYGGSGIPAVNLQNAVGRLYLQEDASGVQGFGYDKLGNLVNHLRGVAVAGRHTFWFQTEWVYDSQNRIRHIKYPDFETVNGDSKKRF